MCEERVKAAGRRRRLLDSISSKIIVLMVLLILPLNLLVILATSQSINVVQSQALLSMESAANLYMQQLDSRIAAINSFLFGLEEDASLMELTAQRGDNAYHLAQTALAHKLSSSIQASASADGYFLQAPALGDFLLVLPGGSDAATRDARREALRTGLVQNVPTRQWQLLELDGTLWLVRAYSTAPLVYGAAISVDDIYAGLGGVIEYGGLTLSLLREAPAAAPKGTLAVGSASERSGLYLHITVPRGEVIRTLPLLQWLTLVLAFAYLLLIPVLLLLLHRILLRPLGTIRSALLRLKEGDQAHRISSHNYSAEFRSINQSFNDMADNIHTLKLENYEKEAARQRMELSNLQLQIRPHFLLNMFKLVYSLAQIQDFASIQKLALYLSSYFRHIFRSGRALESFAQEFALIQEYLDISALRYPGAFTVEYAVEDAALGLPVPPLLVHNFIENITGHALDSGRCVHILLAARVVDGTAQFTIRDDGLGMPAEVVRRINAQDFTNRDGTRVHVGIQNSWQRLRYFYGEESRLEVSSAPGEGCEIRISFPCGEKEEGHEPVDCG